MLITSLSIGKDTGIVALEGVVEKTFSKALEDHLLTCIRRPLSINNIDSEKLNKCGNKCGFNT